MSESKIVPREPTQAMLDGASDCASEASPDWPGTIALWRAMYDAAPSAATPAPDVPSWVVTETLRRLRAAPAVSAPDVAALIAEFPWANRAYNVLRRLSAPAGELPENDFPRITELLAKYGHLSLGQSMERIEAAEALAQQRGERIAELEKDAAIHVAWLRWVRRDPDTFSLELCDADSPDAFKVYRRCVNPAAALAAQDKDANG